MSAADVVKAARALVDGIDRWCAVGGIPPWLRDETDALRAALRAYDATTAKACPVDDATTDDCQSPEERTIVREVVQEESNRAYCPRCRIAHPVIVKCLRCGKPSGWRCAGLPVTPCDQCGRTPNVIVPMKHDATGSGGSTAPSSPQL